MSEARRAIFAWAAEERLAAAAVPEALRIADVTPDALAWRRFIDRLLLGLGTALVGGGIIFFVAANWQAMGRFVKFGLVEAALVGAIAVCAWRGLASRAGQAALFAAALLAGALLALVGQVYQTGADTYELFAVWAAAIGAWVLVARMPALWLLWLAIVNVSLVFFFAVRPWHFLHDGSDLLLTLFVLDAVALAAWEVLVRRGVAWLSAAWATRTLAFAAGGAITAAVVMFALDRHFDSGYSLIFYAAWLAAMYGAYRRGSVDLFMLGGLVLSVAVAAAALAMRFLEGLHDARILLVGLMISGIATVGARWLRRVAIAERAT